MYLREDMGAVGTKYFVNLEMVAREGYNFKTVIWSCGVVLYRITTLRRPPPLMWMVIRVSGA